LKHERRVAVSVLVKRMPIGKGSANQRHPGACPWERKLFVDAPWPFYGSGFGNHTAAKRDFQYGLFSPILVILNLPLPQKRHYYKQNHQSNNDDKFGHRRDSLVSA
jgi:hypothetical protein